VGFGIRELMTFIEMICREFKKEDDVQVEDPPNLYDGYLDS
jgi:hypothetical protein